MSTLSPDQPIDSPEQDFFGFDPFARTVARSIAALKSPDGLVVGLHGPWGAGKSSAVNLIKYHLKAAQDAPANGLTIIEFNPWWFTGEGALALAFFAEIGAVLDRSLKEKARSAFRSIGRQLAASAPILGAAVDLATKGVGGSAAAHAAKLAGDLLSFDRTVPEEHAALSKELRQLGQRFLIIVDDIDRLAPDDALLVFKLVKSVGRLPNIIYLLIFDKTLAERNISDKFPSEGPKFLEKIIQASFELPPPQADDLRDMLLGNVERIMGVQSDEHLTRFMNLFYDIVAPQIKIPRDVVRLTNALEVTWPAVAGEVDKSDFLSMETIRLVWPSVYRALYDNKGIVCRRQDFGKKQSDAVIECEYILLNGVVAAQSEQVKTALRRLFPVLESVWGNVHYGEDHAQIWRRERRVCAEVHFDTYFRFAISDRTVSRSEFNSFISASHNCEEVKRRILAALEIPRRRGGTRAALLLEELTANAPNIPETHIAPILSGIFTVADVLDVEADRARGFYAHGDNHLRIHWLINRLVTQRLAEASRDALIEEAISCASLAWAIELALRCVDEHTPKDDGRLREGPNLVSADSAEKIRLAVLSKIRTAAADGSFWNLKNAVKGLFYWRGLAGNEQIKEIRIWLGQHIFEDTVIIKLANSFVSDSWSHGMSDRVARRSDYVNRESVETLLDASRYLTRIDEMLTNDALGESDRAVLQRFKSAWEASGRR